MTPKRLFGALTATCGVMYYAWHIVQGGMTPHVVRANIGAIGVLAGVWLSFSPAERRTLESSVRRTSDEQ